MKKASKVIYLAIIALTVTSCWYNHKWDTLHPITTTTVPAPCVVPDTASYTRDIKPIINLNCGVTDNRASQCHGAGNTSGYDYTTYAGLFQSCRHDSSSLVYEAITGTQQQELMPKGGPKLSQCDINKITNWLNQGAPNN